MQLVVTEPKLLKVGKGGMDGGRGGGEAGDGLQGIVAEVEEGQSREKLSLIAPSLPPALRRCPSFSLLSMFFPSPQQPDDGDEAVMRQL